MSSSSDVNVRKSRRQSGIRPELSIAQAQEVVDSPRRKGRRDSECSSSVASVEVVSVKKHKAAAKPDIAVIAEVEDDAPEIVQEVVEVEKESSEEPEVVEEVATKATEDEVKVIGARQIVGEVVAEAVQHTESTKVTEIVEEEPVTSKTASKVTHPAQEKENRPKVTSNLEIKAKVIPKGKPKSGRFWKSDRDRFRSVIKSKGLKMSFEQRLKRKEEMIKAKAFEQSLKDEVKQRKEDQKRRREENAKRREENQKKSEVVEIIKNPNKIKRMKRKQLRMIAKRDILDKVQKK